MTTKLKATLGVLGVLVVAGVACWIYQLMNGLGVTGMSNANSWGLYIICFMFMVGLSAGGLIVASSASVFHVTEYKKVALPAIILSTVCICMAGMFVLIDLGGMQRAWRILTGPNPISPLFWDICVITCYLVINIVYLVMMKKHGANSTAVSRVSRFALPVSASGNQPACARRRPGAGERSSRSVIVRITVNANDREILSQAFAFLGNSLLKPMSQTSDIGLDPAFWEAFPTFDDPAVEEVCAACAHFARTMEDAEDAMRRVDVEYAHLFVGPPKPAVPPWETAFRTEGGIGFGQATVEVRHVLAGLGLAVRNENNQYADHMGLEILRLSEMCKRVAAGDERASTVLEPFAREHPASWAGEFAQRVRTERPDGYYAGVTAVVEALSGLVCGGAKGRSRILRPSLAIGLHQGKRMA